MFSQGSARESCSPDALISALEADRRHTSEMLHDHLGQLLTLARMEVASIPAEDLRYRETCQKVLARLDDCLDAVRRIARTLHPAMLEDLGLLAALDTLVEDMDSCTPYPVTIARPPSLPPIPRDHELILFRTIQEALTNALRHAGARRIEVRIEIRDGGIYASVEDDGAGFDNRAANHERSIGLLCMRERVLRVGGEWALVSRPGNGTRIAVYLPPDVPVFRAAPRSLPAGLPPSPGRSPRRRGR